MRVVLVITSLGMGGAETVVCRLADGLVERGHEVKVISLGSEISIIPNNDKVELVALGAKSILSWIKSLPQILREIRSFGPDVIHTHMFHANLTMRFLKIFIRSSALINSAHNANEGSKWRMLAYRFTDQLADVFTNVSDEAARCLEKKGAAPKGRIRTVYNGVPVAGYEFDECARSSLRKELLEDDSSVLLVNVGSLTKQKDQHCLLDAFAKLKEETNVDLRLCIVGEGPLRQELLEHARKLLIHQSVSFMGIRRDIPRFMSAADIFVLSSAWEGFGLVVAEAMVARRPVVATNCGGVKEVLGGEGLLVSPKNPSELAGALKVLLGMPSAQRDEMGRRASERIKNLYSHDVAMEKWVSLYAGSFNRT